MTEFLVDQNFNEDIVDGMTRLVPSLEFTYLRDIGLETASDPTVLEWAAQYGMVLLTHDRKTLPPFAYARVAEGLPMPGVFLVSDQMPKGQAIDELLLAIQYYGPDECKDQVHHFPL